jgi:hypothetical protein
LIDEIHHDQNVVADHVCVGMVIVIDHLFHVYYHILIDQIHHDENVDADHVWVGKVIVIEIVIDVMKLIEIEIVIVIFVHKDNINHNNQDMSLPNMMNHDDVLHVEQVV